MLADRKCRKKPGESCIPSEKLTFGRPSMAFVSIQLKIQEVRSSNLELMKSIAGNGHLVKQLRIMICQHRHASHHPHFQPRLKSDCIRTNNAC